MSKSKRIKWQKIVSREYSFLYADYTNDAYKIMEKTVGTMLRHHLFYGENNILNIYREYKDIERSYDMIDKLAVRPSKIVALMDAYDELVKKNYQLFNQIKRSKNRTEIKEKLKELDNVFLLTVIHFLFFVFLGYAADRPNIKAFLKKQGKRFKKIRMYTIDMDMNAEFPKCFAKYDKRLLKLSPYMNRQELASFLNTGRLDRQKIIDRFKNYLVITKDLKTKEYKLPDITQTLKRELAHLKIDRQAKRIKGATACPGKAEGRAVIVLAKKDYHKIKTGDILITPMTKPDIIPYLKRVKGIITNDGGALSHASIISREMKIPCLTGTRYATDIIKDGEILKLEATRGWVERSS